MSEMLINDIVYFMIFKIKNKVYRSIIGSLSCIGNSYIVWGEINMTRDITKGERTMVSFNKKKNIIK